MEWSHDEVLAAVCATLGRPPRSWSFEHAEIDGNQVLVAFRVDGQRFGVYYSLADLPVGPHTGERCDTPDDWAIEIVLDIDEQVETGGVVRAERISGPDDLDVLRWRW